MPDNDMPDNDGAADDIVPVFSNGAHAKPWAFDAYCANVGRGETLTSLARLYGVQWRTVKRNVEAVHAMVLAIERSDAIDAHARHVARLAEVLRAAWRDHDGAEDGQRAAFLRVALDAGEKLAAAAGVVTERKSTQVTGADGGPVKVEIVIGTVPAANAGDVLSEIEGDSGDEAP